MAFQLRPKESLSEGIRRNVRRQIEKALVHMRAEREPHERVSSENEPDAKEVRKSFKKVRAALRLIRQDLGDEVYRDENFCFRDAGRLLREIRDAQVLLEIVDKLTAQSAAESADTAAWAKIRETLLEHRQDVVRCAIDDGASAAVKEVVTGALARLPDWTIAGDGWAAMERGLRRVYRAGHRALALAVENPSVANLHEWRKQARHLRSQLQLLEGAWGSAEKELDEHTHELLELLGEDHDLALLRETLANDPTAYGGHRILKGLFAVIDRRREELERQAFIVGRKLYKDPPKVFTDRIEAYWKAWAGEIQIPKPPARSDRAEPHKVSARNRQRTEVPDMRGLSASGNAAIDRRKSQQTSSRKH